MSPWGRATCGHRPHREAPGRRGPHRLPVASDQRGKGYGRELLRLLLGGGPPHGITEGHPGHHLTRQRPFPPGGKANGANSAGNGGAGSTTGSRPPGDAGGVAVHSACAAPRPHEAAARALAWYQDADTYCLVEWRGRALYSREIRGDVYLSGQPCALYWMRSWKRRWLPSAMCPFGPEISHRPSGQRWRGRGVGKAVVERLIARGPGSWVGSRSR